MNGKMYLDFLDSCRNARQNLIADSLAPRDRNPDLYDAFWSDYQSDEYKIRLELYHLRWLEDQWLELENSINKMKGLSNSELQKVFDHWLDWYKEFLSQWNMTKYDLYFLPVMLKGFENIIKANERWSNKANVVKTDIKKFRRQLETMREGIKGE